MPSKFLNLLTLSTLAVLACSSVVSADHRVARGHDSIAKRKRDSTNKRCKTRSSSAIATATSTFSDVPSTTPAASTPAPTSSAPAAPPAAPSSSAVSVPPPSGGGGGGNGKVGLAWPNGDDPSLANYVSGQVGYIYTWSPFIPPAAKSLGLKPMPQLWGFNQVDSFKQMVVAGYADIVLGMNEPNEPGQSNMSPQDGIQLWQQYIQPLAAEGYRLISPATSSSPAGKVWMQDFFKGCNGCTFDGVALHWYDVGFEKFQAYVEDFHTTFNNQIWVTEYACQNFNGGAQCSDNEVWEFMTQAKQWMDATDYVAGYFAFGIMHDMQGVNNLNQLMSASGAPTDLGNYYIHN